MLIILELVLLCTVMEINLIQGDFQSDINEITDEIIRSYFVNFDCLIFITEKGEEPPLTPSFKSTKVTATLNSEVINTAILEQMYDIGCRGFIIKYRNRSNLIAELINAYRKSLTARYNNKRYLFLACDETDRNVDFLEDRNMYFMRDLLYVSPDDNASGFHLVTHNFFDGHKYDIRHEKHEIIDHWQPEVGMQKNASLYWDRLANLHGKEMIFALINYGPYTLIFRDGDKTVYDGVETRIVAIFADKMNATWTGKDHPVHLWGDILENGSSNGILGSVMDHTADIGFAALYQWHCDIMDCSYPYIYAGVTCLAPKPRLLSGWYTIVLPFEITVWGAILLSYISCSIFLFILSVLHRRITSGERWKQERFAILLESFFYLFRMLLEQAPRDTGARTPITAFLKIWTLYSFFVAASWQGGIASFLTVPRHEEPIREPKDLVERWPKMEWGGAHIDWTKSISQTTEPVLLTIVNKFKVFSQAELRRRVLKRNFAHFMERLPNGHYGVNDYVDEESMKYLRIMESNFYIGNCIMILPKCSPYSEGLDKILFWMFDTGLIQKLEIQTSLEKMNNRLQNMIKMSAVKESEEDIALLVSHIQGAIFIYAFGILIALLAFIFEIYANWMKISRKRKGKGIGPSSRKSNWWPLFNGWKNM